VSTDVRSELLNAGHAAIANRHGRPFIRSIRAFVAALKRVPDGGPSDYQHEQLVAIRDLGERVIAEIEDRLEDADDRPQIQRELAEAIYSIRRAVENIYRWERHFLSTKAPVCSTEERPWVLSSAELRAPRRSMREPTRTSSPIEQPRRRRCS
jgi:hypothetical protein